MPFSTPVVYETGRLVENFVGNGKSLTSLSTTELAAYVNMIMSRRLRVLLCEGVQPSQAVGVSSAQAFFAGIRTGPEVRTVTAHVICLPSDNTSNGIIPRGHFRLQADPASPGTAFNQPSFQIGKRTSTTATPNDMFVIEQRWDGKGGTTALSANTEYYVALQLTDYARVMAVMIYEEPWSTFKTTTVTGVNPNSYITGAPLLDTPFDNLGDRLLTKWKKGGPTIFTTSRPSGTNITTSSTSYVNIYDSAYTSYNASAPGFWSFPYKQGSYHSSNVPIRFAVVASDSFNGGSIAFVTATGTLATITVNGSVATGYYTADANLDSSQTEQKIDILMRTGTSTCSLQFATCYSFEA